MEFKSLLPSVFSGGASRDPFRALQRQIDHLFEDFSRDVASVTWPRNGSFGLAIDVAETDKAIDVTTELPGVDEKDISVTLTGETLAIEAEKKSEKEEKGKDYRLSERSYGKFERRIDLPFKADPSKMEAKFDKGVLRISIQKPAEIQKLSQKIPVKAAA